MTHFLSPVSEALDDTSLDPGVVVVPYIVFRNGVLYHFWSVFLYNLVSVTKLVALLVP